MGVLNELYPTMGPATHLWRVGLDEPKGRTADLLVAHIQSASLVQMMQKIVEYDHPALIAVPSHLTHIVLDEKEFVAARLGRQFAPIVLDFADIGVSPYAFHLIIPAKPELNRLVRECGLMPRNEYHVTLAYANRRIDERLVPGLRDRIRSARLSGKLTGKIGCLQHLRRTPKHTLPFEYSVVRTWEAKEPIEPVYSESSRRIVPRSA